jgi:hypothetical protein
MKNLRLVLLLSLLVLGSCMRNEYLVESDYSYSGTFKNYKTFDFMTEIGANKDSTDQREAIQNSVKRRMELQGYRYKSKNPDLLVSYKMFYGDFDFYGYNQPDFENWLVYENEDEAYDPVSYNMYEGTIIVILWDRKKRRVVWQGYATTMFGNPYQNEKYIKWAVRSIFDQYRVFGEELENQNRNRLN